jgi:hypothetical protein
MASTYKSSNEQKGDQRWKELMNNAFSMRTMRASRLAAHYLDASFKTLGFTAEQRKYFCEHPEAFRYGDTPSECKPEFTRYTRSGFDHGVFHSLYATLEEVRERRAQLANVEDKNIFSQAKLNSEVSVRSLIVYKLSQAKA